MQLVALALVLVSASVPSHVLHVGRSIGDGQDRLAAIGSERSELMRRTAVPAQPAGRRKGADGRIAVFVSAPTKDGFVDASKDVLDSVRDIRTRLAKMKEFITVDRREAATLVVTVIDRGVGSEAYGQRIRASDLFGVTEITNSPMFANTFWIAGVLEVGNYRRRVVGAYTHEYSASLGAWSNCANQIVKDIRTWSQANAEVLNSLR